MGIFIPFNPQIREFGWPGPDRTSVLPSVSLFESINPIISRCKIHQNHNYLSLHLHMEGGEKDIPNTKYVYHHLHMEGGEKYVFKPRP